MKANLFNVLGITEHADLHLRPWDVRQLDGTAEPFVLLRVVVLETNLELDGLGELARLCLLAVSDHGGDRLSHGFTLELTASFQTKIKIQTFNKLNT